MKEGNSIQNVLLNSVKAKKKPHIDKQEAWSRFTRVVEEKNRRMQLKQIQSIELSVQLNRVAEEIQQ